MSNTAIAKVSEAEIVNQVLMTGDLKRLTYEQKNQYMLRVCETVGLNPITRPFEFINFQGKEVMYARRDCTDQLRKKHRISIEIVDRVTENGIHSVRARATTPDGRCDESVGALVVDKLQGEALANALMKAETKAKRRVTLSICGLGMLDESEFDTMRGANVEVTSDGEVVDKPAAPALTGKDWESGLGQQWLDEVGRTQSMDELRSVVEDVNKLQKPKSWREKIGQAVAARKVALEAQ